MRRDSSHPLAHYEVLCSTENAKETTLQSLVAKLLCGPSPFVCMTWSTLRLEGRALEQCLVQVLDGSSARTSIRMQSASGEWVSVSSKKDPRVKRILSGMLVLATEMADGLRESGFTLRRADQLVELASGQQHSVDLVLEKGRVQYLVEMKWSVQLVRARREAAHTLGDWLAEAARACTLISPSGRRSVCAASTAGALCVSPHNWALEINGCDKSAGSFTRDVREDYVVVRGRSGNSGSAKRSRNPATYRREQTYRRQEGHEQHKTSTLDSAHRRRGKPRHWLLYLLRFVFQIDFYCFQLYTT